MSHIDVRDPSGGVHRYPLEAEVTRIGRSALNDLSLPDHLLSRHHIEIHRRGQEFFVVDLGSRNGTIVNGERLEGERLLQPGDRVALGDFLLTFAPLEDPFEDEAVDEGAVIPVEDFARLEVDTDPQVAANELRRQRQALTILTRAASALVAHRPLDEMFEFVLDQIFEAIPADRGAVLLLEGVPPHLVIRASRSREGPEIDRISQSIARRAVEQRMAFLLKKVMEDPDLRSRDSVSSLGIRSALCAPLWIHGGTPDSEQVIGLVYLDKQSETESFDEDDLRLLTALANVAASKIEQTRLLEESLQKRRLEQDLARAAEIQLALLPERTPHVPGCELAGSTTPCLAVGGDYYDFDKDGDALLVALGDVAGKGTAAALLTTVLRSAVRGHWRVPDVAQAVTRINTTVTASIPEFRYVTFFLGRFEPGSCQLDYVNAGHNPPLLVRADGSYEKLHEGGAVLGMFGDSRYAAGRQRLQPGDVLVAFSDGVSEAGVGDQDEFGEERIAQAVLAARAGSAEQIRTSVLSAAEAFAAGMSPSDDRTLVVLKCR